MFVNSDFNVSIDLSESRVKSNVLACLGFVCCSDYTIDNENRFLTAFCSK